MSALIPAWGQDGNLRPVEKLDVHKQGLRHKAVSVFVTCKDMILLQQRALEKYHTPGLWANTCCTHPGFYEDDKSCGIRRLQEELNLSVQEMSHVGEIEYRADVGSGLIEHEVVQVFHATLTVPSNITPNPAEVETTKWMPLPDIMTDIRQNPARYTPWFRIYMHNHLDMILPDHRVIVGA